MEGYKRMSATSSSLELHIQNDPNVKRPYSAAQISRSAVYRETLHIYRSARKETKAVYDLGHDPKFPKDENWVIRWMLWHIFRYRDHRNKNRRRKGDGVSVHSTNGTGTSLVNQLGRCGSVCHARCI